MRNLILIIASLLCIVSCKEEDDENIGSFDFSYANDVVAVNDTVFFTALGSDFETVSWDFGDGKTGEGLEVYHIYSSFDCFNVTATAKKGGTTKSISKDVPVTKFKRLVVTSVDIMQIPVLGPNGQDYDPNDDPDLTIKLTLPDDSVYLCPITISNSRSGTFVISPAKTTRGISQQIRIDAYDKDLGSVPELTPIGYANFKICPSIVDTSVNSFNDSTVFSNLGIKFKIRYSWGI